MIYYTTKVETGKTMEGNKLPVKKKQITGNKKRLFEGVKI